MLEGRRINFRAIEDEDAVVFHRWFNDPDVTRFLNTDAFPVLSLAEERAIVQRLRENKDLHTYAIVLKDGALIGSCSLRAFNWPARSCEIGIAIGEKAQWSKGYGGDAVDLLLKIAFDHFNLHKVWLTCAAYNERGLAAYRRVGFREDGRLRDDRFIDGQYHDTIVMSILEQEWRSRATEATATEAVQPSEVAPAEIEQPPAPDEAAPIAEQRTLDEATVETVQPSAEAGPPVFNLTLHKTYYNQGFFNVPVEIDEQVRQSEGPIELVLGDNEQPIAGRLDRKTNPNKTARIFGGSKLRQWFRANFQVLDPIEVEIVSPDRLHLRAAATAPREE